MQPATAILIWQIWARRRVSIWLVIGITLFTGVFYWLYEDIIRAAQEDRSSAGFPLVAELLIQHLAVATFLLLLSVFNYTEFNQQKGSAGFPHRLLVLPVSSFRLVAVPMAAGAGSAVLIALAWGIWTGGSSWQLALGFPVYMLSYQGINWTLPGLRAGRMLVLGALAFGLFALPILFSLKGIPETYAAGPTAGLGVFAFVASWISVARQRSGGGANRAGIKGLVEWFSDRLPGRDKPFRSAAAAQFWFEWRRSGLVLPALVAGLLLVAIAPLSWIMQSDAAGLQRILMVTLAMPVILALPVGKGFSKPDLWTGDLGIPGVIAVRPLSAGDIVMAKMKVAAVSAAISWLVVLVFLFLWSSLWGKLDFLSMIRYSLWQLYVQSLYPQYAIAALSIFAGIFLTWRFLVGSQWLGLSGRKVLFSISALPYAIVPFVALAGILVFTRDEQSVIARILNNLDATLPAMVWIAAAALIAKLWFAAFSWRNTHPVHVRGYLLCWIAGSSCLVALAIFASQIASIFVPAHTARLRSLLILGALLLMPLARVGVAQSSLAKNRHR